MKSAYLYTFMHILILNGAAIFQAYAYTHKIAWKKVQGYPCVDIADIA